MKDAEKKDNNKKRHSKLHTATTIVLVIIFLAGLSLMLYPTVSNWWNQRHQTQAIAGYVKKTKDMSKEERKKMWDEATAYNQKLSTQQTSFNLTDAEMGEYNKTLDVTGTGIMGYIEIPSIKVSLPIYHGVDQAVLQIAVGHIPGSSLPVGGSGSHCVLSGHRGLPSATLFTHLDRMQVGDHFMLKVLDKTLTYEVDQIRTVLPDEIDDLDRVPGQDYCTLVTCTPYQVNTHRLLVRGHRVPNDLQVGDISEEAVKLDPKMAAAILGVVLYGLLLIVTFILSRRKQYLEKKDQKGTGNDGTTRRRFRKPRHKRKR